MRFRKWYWVAQCVPLDGPRAHERKSGSTRTELHLEIEPLEGDMSRARDLFTQQWGGARPHPDAGAERTSSAKR